jgi:ABC-type amino acid transport substrate-binding protein
MRLFSSFLLLLFLWFPAEAQQSLVLSCADDLGSRASLAVLSAAYGKLGVEVTAQHFPAKRSLNESSQGLSDGEVNRVKSIGLQFPTLKRITVPVNVLHGVAYTCRKDIVIKSWDDLKQHRVGIRIGIIFAENHTKNIPNLIRMSTYDTLFELLYKGRLDVVISGEIIGKIQARRFGTDCFKAQQPPLLETNLYHFLHQNKQAIIPRITEVLQEMETSGEAEQIRQDTTKKLLSNIQKSP